MSTFEAKSIVHANLLKISKIANMCSGYIYGGCVRDFFIAETDAKDIDIWFTCEEDILKFKNLILEVGLIESSIYSSIYNKNEIICYPFTREQVYLTTKDGCKFIVDLIKNKEFPVNDFAVNDLILDDGLVKHIDRTEYSLKLVIDLIKQRQMEPKQSFIDRFYSYKNDTLGAMEYFYPRLASFISRGWDLGIINNHFVIYGSQTSQYNMSYTIHFD